MRNTYQDISDQSPPTPAIGAVAGEIHKAQAHAVELREQKLTAEIIAGQAAALHQGLRFRVEAAGTTPSSAFAAGRDPQPSDVVEAGRRAEAAHARLEAIAVEQAAVEVQLSDLQTKIDKLHTEHRIRLALGGRKLDRPALGADAKVEYTVRLQAFADRLREAAIACEAAWPVFEHLGGTVAPWPELRVSSADSKFSRWVAEALDQGAIR